MAEKPVVVREMLDHRLMLVVIGWSECDIRMVDVKGWELFQVYDYTVMVWGGICGWFVCGVKVRVQLWRNLQHE